MYLLVSRIVWFHTVNTLNFECHLNNITNSVSPIQHASPSHCGVLSVSLFILQNQPASINTLSMLNAACEG